VGSIETYIDGIIHLLPALILLKYPLTFLKLGESMPGLQEVSYIDGKKYCELVTILNQILLKYPLTFLKLGASFPGLQ
jgi:hypothetical protein